MATHEIFGKLVQKAKVGKKCNFCAITYEILFSKFHVLWFVVWLTISQHKKRIQVLVKFHITSEKD